MSFPYHPKTTACLQFTPVHRAPHASRALADSLLGGAPGMIDLDLLVGYPRRVGQKLFNSVSLVAPDGTTVYTYDKTFLYEADETWAEEGSGFTCVEVIGLGKVGPGICMDINPYRFAAPFEDYEFATFQAQSAATILPLSMAWILPDDEPPGDSASVGTVKYWALRMRPVVEAKEDVLVIAANRTGSENVA
ncbi:Carbon-nitrogen hydrolase [Geranomyces variabilis]|uniref:Carbon-nitrogen hydrolase n=1 Tax=Geranomyces variabilis TaxID=109894 RepID=A0AAD5TLM3_9FUNG|nr:Carbon-nitrogen hydrolase [Geranomyces variabilis]